MTHETHQQRYDKLKEWRRLRKESFLAMCRKIPVLFRKGTGK